MKQQCLTDKSSRDQQQGYEKLQTARNLAAKHPAISFLVAYTVLFIVIFTIAFCSFYYAGKSFFRDFDGIDQHYLFFVYVGKWLREIVRTLFETGQFIIPMWNTGIGFGGDPITTMGAYLGDPFNWVSAIVPPEYSEGAFNAVIIARFYFTGVAFALYGRNHGGTFFSLLCGSISYAFSGYMLVTFTESFFSTPMVLFPILLLGVDRLFQRNSPVILIIASWLFFLSYFYFAYMACLLLVPYCICCYLKYAPKKEVGAFLLWTLKTLSCLVVGALMASALLLPVVYAILGAGRLSLEYHIPLLYEISYYPEFLSGLVSVQYLTPDAYIGFGCIGLLALVLLFSRKGNAYAKVAFIGLTACALLPYAGHVLNGFAYVANRWIWAYALCVSFIVMRMAPTFIAMTSKETKAYVIVACTSALLFYLIPNTRSMSVAVCMAVALGLAVILVAWKAGLFEASSQARKSWLLAVLAVSVCLPPQLVYSEDSSEMYSEVKSGIAWRSIEEGPSTLAMRAIEDESLWRYDLAGIYRIRNSSDIVRLNSFDFYISIYNGRVDELLTDLELHSSIYNMLITDLDRRSYLESAFGAKYFLIPTGREYLLPYGCSETPVLTTTIPDIDTEPEASETKETEYSVYENTLALPLAYTFESTVPQEQLGKLSGVQLQQAILQACATEAPTDYENAQLSFNDFSAPYEITQMHNCSFDENGDVVVTEPGAFLEISFQGHDDSELYVEVKGLEFTGAPPKLEKDVSLQTLKQYLEESYLYSEPNDYSIDIACSDGPWARLDGLTDKNHMYSGKNSNLVNLGYKKERDETIAARLFFDTEGIFSFDELNVIYQPMNELTSLVEQRKTGNPDVIAGLNSYTATLSHDSNSLLMFTVPYSTGWSATIDGENTEIMQANIAFMAVSVPPGEHKIVLSYTTPMLREGLVLNSIGIVILIVVTLYRRIRQRKTGYRINS